MAQDLRLELAGLRAWAVSAEQAEAQLTTLQSAAVPTGLIGDARLAERLAVRLVAFEADRVELASRLARISAACRLTADRFDSLDRALAGSGARDDG